MALVTHTHINVIGDRRQPKAAGPAAFHLPPFFKGPPPSSAARVRLLVLGTLGTRALWCPSPVLNAYWPGSEVHDTEMRGWERERVRACVDLNTPSFYSTSSLIMSRQNRRRKRPAHRIARSGHPTATACSCPPVIVRDTRGGVIY